MKGNCLFRRDIQIAAIEREVTKRTTAPVMNGMTVSNQVENLEVNAMVGNRLELMLQPFMARVPVPHHE